MYTSVLNALSLDLRGKVNPPEVQVIEVYSMSIKSLDLSSFGLWQLLDDKKHYRSP